MRLSACTITDALLNMHTDYSIPALSTTFFYPKWTIKSASSNPGKALYNYCPLPYTVFNRRFRSTPYQYAYVRIYIEWRELYGEYVIQWKFGYDRFFRAISWRCLHSVCDV